ncbi:MAG: FAD-binding protein [Planctomycetales bacterium]|nr:FAD-binding protein [Planctomycetales bacterium]
MAFSKSLQHLLRENEPLAAYSWLKIGGPARYFAEPGTLEELQQLLAEAQKLSLPVRLLGGGSNILIREAGVDGLVVSLAAAKLSDIKINGPRMLAGGGAKLNHVISAGAAAGLAGLEHLAGIPGTLGGAVASNAGVTNDDIGSRVTRVKVVDRQGKAVERTRESLQFGFRRSNLDDVVIVEVELALEKLDPLEVTRRMQANWIVKRAAQPLGGLRTIQAFIEPDGTSLSEALDAAGMKDVADGEVALSPQYPGFLTVSGQATSEQVLALMERVAKAVEIRCGIQLQSQVKIW